MLRLALLFCLAAPAFAQTGPAAGTIAGTVTDADGRPLPGANVVVVASSLGAAADAEGGFVIPGLAPGRVELAASLLGYARETQSVEVVAGDTVRVRFALAETALDVGEIVVRARESLTGERVLDLPGSGHVLGREAIRESGGDALRALRAVPGVNLQEEDGYGLRPNIGLRGTGSERSSKVTLMEDGVLIAPAPYAAPAAYYAPTLGRMDGVEVRTGAGQIQYGPATTGGAVNFVSARIPSRLEASGEALVGENGRRTVHARLGDARQLPSHQLGGLGVGFVAEVRRDDVDGFKTIQGPAGAALDGDTGFGKTDLFGRVRVSTPAGASVYQSVTLTGSWTDEVSNETYLGLTDADFDARPFARYAGSQRDQMDAEQTSLRARHVAVFSDRLDLVTTVYRNAFARNWYKLDTVSGTDGTVGIASLLADPATYPDELAIVQGAGAEGGRLAVKANNRVYLSRGVQTTAGWRAAPGALVEVGARLHADEMDRFQWVDRYAIAGGAMTLEQAGTPGTDSNRIESAQAASGFVQADLAVGRVALTPGVRVEHVRMRREDFGKADPDRTGADLSTRENTVTAVIPGVGAVVRLADAWRAFGGLHRGFSPPGSRDETRPESSLNSELGLRYESPALRLQLAGFQTAYRNLLGADLAAAGGGGTSDLFNGGRADVRGLELAADASVPVGGWAVPARLAYTLTDGRFRSSFESEFDGWGTVQEGDALPYLARHQLYGRVGVERGGLSAGLSASVVSAMRARAGQGEIPTADRIPGHVVLDASASAPLPGGLALTATVHNLADATYVAARRPAGLRPGLPRTVSVGLRARLGR